MSRCYRLLGDVKRGRPFAQQALALARETHSLPLEILALRCLAEYPEENPHSCLRRALRLARHSHRQLDQAACGLALAHLDADAALWARAAYLLEKCGADGWLVGHNDHQPLLLPLIM